MTRRWAASGNSVVRTSLEPRTRSGETPPLSSGRCCSWTTQDRGSPRFTARTTSGTSWAATPVSGPSGSEGQQGSGAPAVGAPRPCLVLMVLGDPRRVFGDHIEPRLSGALFCSCPSSPRVIYTLSLHAAHYPEN